MNRREWMMMVPGIPMLLRYLQSRPTRRMVKTAR